MIADQEGRNEGRTCGGVAVRVIAEPIGGGKNGFCLSQITSYCRRSWTIFKYKNDTLFKPHPSGHEFCGGPPTPKNLGPRPAAFTARPRPHFSKNHA